MPGCDISEMLLMSSPENDQEPKTVGDRTACEVISVQFILNFTRAEAPCEQAGPRAWARFTHQESDWPPRLQGRVSGQQTDKLFVSCLDARP